MPGTVSPVIPALGRLVETHTIESRWDMKKGWYQVVINKTNGKEWDVGKTYDHDGWVKRLNEEVGQGMYS
jgi:hypothetical protein